MSALIAPLATSRTPAGRTSDRHAAYARQVQALVHALEVVPTTKRNGQAYALSTYAGKLRKAARVFGPVNPFGTGNTKTGAPGSYRPVGSTCPDSCAYHPDNSGSCYALFDKVGYVQVRALTDAWAGLRAVACALMLGRYTDQMVRLQTSGDFGRTWSDAALYVRLLTILCRLMGGSGSDPVAWTYTHLPPDAVGRRMVARLQRAGVAVRWSDRPGRMGALVTDFRSFDPKARGAFRCRAQLQSITCSDCTLCWTLPALAVGFDAHGAGARKALAANVDRMTDAEWVQEGINSILADAKIAGGVL